MDVGKRVGHREEREREGNQKCTLLRGINTLWPPGILMTRRKAGNKIFLGVAF